MACSAPQKGITINELSARLRLSRNFITRNITHCVKHVEEIPSKGATVLYDESQLREHLKNICTFSRQTKRIDLELELKAYIKQHPDDPRIKERNFQGQFIGKIPHWGSQPKRSLFPAIPLPAADFWDFPLIFPKEYTQGNEDPEAERVTAELCYRDMFKIGAIKIQLGRQKTMFYIPRDEGVLLPPLDKLSEMDNRDEKCFLVPADWTPFYEGCKELAPSTNTANKVQISITADFTGVDQLLLEKALRKGFAINYLESLTVDPKNNLTTVTFQATPIDDSIPISPSSTKK